MVTSRDIERIDRTIERIDTEATSYRHGIRGQLQRVEITLTEYGLRLNGLESLPEKRNAKLALLIALFGTLIALGSLAAEVLRMIR